MKNARLSAWIARVTLVLTTPTLGTAKYESHRSVPLLIHVQARKNIEIAYYIVLQGDVTIVSYGSHIMIPVAIGSVQIQDLNNPGSGPFSPPSELHVWSRNVAEK